MTTTRRRSPWLSALTVILLGQFFLPVSAPAQQSEPVTVHGKGPGSIAFLTEERKLTAAVVVLRPNSTALITLISDIQVQAEAQWAASRSSSQEIELKITGGELMGNATGTGKLLLSDDGKSSRELMIQAKLFDGRDLTITFVSEAADPARSERINVVAYPCMY